MKHKDVISKSLNCVELFSELSTEQIIEVENLCHWQAFDTKQQIIHFLDSSDDIYFVTEGIVRAKLYSYSGKVVAFRDIAKGEFFGEIAAIDNLPRSATVEALSPGTIAILTSVDFWTIMRSNPSIMEYILRYSIRQVRSLTERIYEFSVLPVKNRIHLELLRLCQEKFHTNNKVVIDPSPTHSEFANRISTHREAVTRELNRLSEIGLIERKGTSICVNDIQRLEQMVDEAIME